MSCLLKCLSLVLWPVAAVLADAPTLNWHFPAGGQRGHSVVVTLNHKADWDSLRVWADSEYLQVTKPAKADAPFSIAIAPEAPLGAIWIRLIDNQGVSVARQFVIGDSLERDEKEPNGSHVTFDLVENGPITINGKLEKGSDVDAFAWDLDAEQWLLIDIDANVLDSPVDPMVRLVDAQGNQLAFVHDADGGGLDPVLRYQAPVQGRYVLLLSGFEYPPKAESRFTDGANVIYRLHAHHEPTPSHLATYQEHEPNQDSESALSLTLQTKMPGVLATAGDEDWYRFIPLEKDQSYIFELRAQVLGSLLDGCLSIRDLSGKELATNDDSGPHTSPDPVLTWKAPSTEPHFIVVRDIRRHGGKQFHYELQAIQATPSAKLTVSQDRWSVNQGATVEVAVAVARQYGHDQAITLTAQGLPEGLSCDPVTIESDKKEATLTIHAKEDLALQSAKFAIHAGNQRATLAFKGAFADTGQLFLNELSTLWVTVLPK